MPTGRLSKYVYRMGIIGHRYKGRALYCIREIPLPAYKKAVKKRLKQLQGTEKADGAGIFFA